MPSQKMLFSSWEALLRASEHGNSVPDITRVSRDLENTTHSHGWFGTQSYEDAIDLARKGWAEGLARMDKEIHMVEDMIPTMTHTYEIAMSRVGPGVIDINRYINGHPEPWIIQEEDHIISSEGNIVRININSGLVWSVNPDELFNKGAKVCSLIKVIEAMGKRVELVISHYCTGYVRSKSDTLLIQTLVKASQDPLDIDRVAFFSAHTSFVRRILFSVMEQTQPDVYQNIVSGKYGLIASWNEPGAINIPATFKWHMSEKEMRQWLAEMIASVDLDVDEFLGAIEVLESLPAPKEYVDPFGSLFLIDGDGEPVEDEDGDEDGKIIDDGDRGAEQPQTPEFCCLRCAWIEWVKEMVK